MNRLHVENSRDMAAVAVSAKSANSNNSKFRAICVKSNLRYRRMISPKYVFSLMGWALSLLLLFDRVKFPSRCLFQNEVVQVAVIEPKVLPYSDFLLVIFINNSPEGHKKRAALKKIYDRYRGHVFDTIETENSRMYTLRVLYLTSSVDVDNDGELDGDVFKVKAPKGYEHIAEMTKQMMALTNHFSFKYLIKSDDDTFLCLRRLATLLSTLPEDKLSKIYAGVPTACGVHRKNPNVGRVILDQSDRWYDSKFVEHTLGGLPCYPVYMQGAFYVLAHSLVEFMNTGRPNWTTFQNEDVTVGSWLLGVDREIVQVDNIEKAAIWGCKCSTNNKETMKSSMFFHGCKTLEELESCSKNLKKPGLLC